METRLLASDGSVKLVFPAGAGRVYEGAFFHVPGRERPFIACVSTQVGCAAGCHFCATRSTGLVRSLTSDEIWRQVSAVWSIARDRDASEDQFEISFMGMGEPLANDIAVLKTIEHARLALPGISRVSVSTVGPAWRIARFALRAQGSPVPIHLQVSLHATLDHVRRRVIPHAPDSVAELVAAAAAFGRTAGDSVCVNYVLMDAVNDTDADAKRLAALVAPHRGVYVKLTHLNDLPDMPGWIRPSPPGRFSHFGRVLSSAGVGYKVFRGDGLDVQASCGQLAAKPVAIYRRVRPA